MRGSGSPLMANFGRTVPVDGRGRLSRQLTTCNRVRPRSQHFINSVQRKMRNQVSRRALFVGADRGVEA